VFPGEFALPGTWGLGGEVRDGGSVRREEEEEYGEGRLIGAGNRGVLQSVPANPAAQL